MSQRVPRSPSALAAGSVRTCVGCRRRAAKSDLLRVVAADRGSGLEVVPDPAGRSPGRGAHLHPTPECLELAVRRRAFPRALRRQTGGGLATTAVQELVAIWVAAGARDRQDEQDPHHPQDSSRRDPAPPTEHRPGTGPAPRQKLEQ